MAYGFTLADYEACYPRHRGNPPSWTIHYVELSAVGVELGIRRFFCVMSIFASEDCCHARNVPDLLLP